MSRIFTTSFASVYPLYVAKVEKKAAHLNPKATSITGVVCGVRVEDVDDPLMQEIRYLDKLVDELAKGKPLDKILRA